MRDHPSDEELLRRFIDSGDQRAFRRLVENYSGLVYHTALRCLGNPSLAEDVSQRVLAILASKAAKVARSGAPLPAWLHRTTVLEAKAVARGEARHHRKKEALMHDPREARDAADSVWRDALPHLDAAIDKLPEADRRVILLHYVNELTFPEIGRRLGKSAAAVQKQSRRAVATLQTILGRRGVTLSIGVLAAGLVTEMSKASPVTLGSLSGGFAKTTTLAVNKTSVAALAATALLCGIPLARQQVALNRLETELAGRDHNEVEPRGAPMARQEPSVISDLRRLAEALRASRTDIVRYLWAVEAVEALPNEALLSTVHKAVEDDLSNFGRQAIFRCVFDTLFERDPEFALSAWVGRVPAEVIRTGGGFSLIGERLRRYAENNELAALAWFEDHLPTIRRLPGPETWPEETLENHLRVKLGEVLVFSNPAAAVEMLRRVPEDHLRNHLMQFGRLHYQQICKQPDGFVAVAQTLLSEGEAAEAFAEVAGRAYYLDGPLMNFQNFDALLASEGLSDRSRTVLLETAGTTAIGVALRHGNGSPDPGIEHYRRWIEEHGHADADGLIGAALARLKTQPGGFESACGWLEQGRSDETIIAFVNSLERLHLRDPNRYSDSPFSTRDVQRIERLAANLAEPDRVGEAMSKIETAESR